MKNTARLLAALLSLIAGPALAQNVPSNTVQGRLAVPPAGGPVQSIPITTLSSLIFNNLPTPLTADLDVVGSITTRRTTATNMGGTFQIGHGAYAWQLLGNQILGGDLILRDPTGTINVLTFPQTGGCMGIQNSISSCPYMLDVGSGAGLAAQRLNGSTFVSGLGPSLTFGVNGALAAIMGTDCAVLASPCNNDFVVKGPVSSRQMHIFGWGGVNVVNTPAISPTVYISGALNVITNSANNFVGGNAITATVTDDTNIRNLGSAFTGHVIAQTTGNSTWVQYNHCDMRAAMECASFEGTVGNTQGAPNPPPAASVAVPTMPFSSSLKATCGNTLSAPLATHYPCSVGLWLKYYLGNGGQQFLYGIYIDEGAASTAGIMVNATSSQSATTSAEFRNSGTGKSLVLRSFGAGSGSNHTFEIQNSGGTSVFSIQNDGTVVAPVISGGSHQLLTTFSLANNGFSHFILSGGTLTANRNLTFTLNDVASIISTNGNVTFGGQFTISGSSAFTVNVGGTTNATFPTGTYTVAVSTSKLSDFAATTSAELKTVISDETGGGLLVFNNAPTLIAPVLGVATATSINGLTVTTSTGTLTIPNTVVLTGPAASGTAMTLGNNETVTGVKTFGSAGAVGKLAVAGTTSGSTILNATAVASGTLTLPAATDTLVGKATTDTFTNKSIDGSTNTLSNVALTSHATQAAFTFVGNNTGSTAAPTAVDIAALTTKASPAAGDYIWISDQAASGAWKKATVSSVSAAGSVASIAGNTGAFTLSGLLTNSTNDLRVLAAAQSDQETATSTTLAVTPGRQQFHPSAVKAFVRWTGSTGTIVASYNVTSVTRNSTGNYNVNFTTGFSASTAYSCVISADGAPQRQGQTQAASLASTSAMRVIFYTTAGAETDPTEGNMICSGDQ